MGEFIEAEYAYRKADELAAESSGADEIGLVPIHYCATGNFKNAKVVIERLWRNDPLNPVISNTYISILGALGNIQQVEEEYKRGTKLFGDSWMGATSIAMIRLSEGVDVRIFDKVLYGDPIWSIIKEHLDSPKVILEE